MDRLDVWRFALAAAVAFAVLSFACALFVIAAPDATIAFFDSWFHGLDLKPLVPAGGKAVTLAQVALGAIEASIVSFVVAAIVAICYNAFGAWLKR
jgi:hypothetical protein